MTASFRLTSRLFTVASCLLAAAALTSPLSAQEMELSEHDILARDIYRELIEINTTDEDGNTTEAAEAMAARLRAAGFPEEDLHIVGPHERKGNLVARLRGNNSNRKPVLLLAHLDVVQALPSDWTIPPFTFLEQDGYYYGRGTADDKAMAAIWIANLIRYKEEGYVPDRDIIVALTADEEGGAYNGVQFLLENHRDLIDAEYTLNEGGGGAMKDGVPLFNSVQLAEKVYQSFRLVASNAGGHSSLPVADNAIYHLVRAVDAISHFHFSIELNEVTRAYFERTARIESPEIAAAMEGILQTPPDEDSAERLMHLAHYNARMRTTCVATRLQAGHADNALPQHAEALINCRILPTQDPAEVLQTLNDIVNNDEITITPTNEPNPSPPTPMVEEVMGPIERLTEAMWPGVPVIPAMSTGATDGLYLRRAGIPVYGVSGLFGDVDDVRAHGRDERMRITSFHNGLEFLYRLVQELTTPIS